MLPYWWALALRLFGERPFLWKLWLLPFGVLLVGSLFQLARQFARGLEWPLVLLTVLSPALLPSLNLMLDVPALALSLAALVLFLAPGGGWWHVMSSGLIAGLATQTKYTSFVIVAALVVRSFLERRPLRGLVAAAVAVLVFGAWEMAIAARYGESHFLLAAGASRLPLPEWFEAKAFLAWPLLTLLGGVAPCLALLGLFALRVSGRVLGAAATASALGYLAVAVVPDRCSAWVTDQEGSPWRVHLDDAVYGAVGLALCGVVTAVCWRLWRWSARRGESGFLVLWLALEVAGYFALTPFPAVRRVLGPVMVVTLLVGSLAARTWRLGARRRWVIVLVAGGALLGSLFWVVDLYGALAHKTAAEELATRLRGGGPSIRVWFVGHWGFQFYAERAGMLPMIPDASRLRTGDWLLVPAEHHIHQQQFVPDPRFLELLDEYQAVDGLPLRTVRCYYGGHIPLEHQEGPRLFIRVYRVRADHVPAWKALSR